MAGLKYEVGVMRQPEISNNRTTSVLSWREQGSKAGGWCYQSQEPGHLLGAKSAHWVGVGTKEGRHH